MDLEKILNSLVADELFAFLEYIFLAIAAKGTGLNAISEKLNEIAKDELTDHYVKLTNWMQANKIKILFNLDNLKSVANNPMDNITDGISTEKTATLLLNAEMKAIDAYNTYAKQVQVEYPELNHLLLDIMNDEIEHKKEAYDLISQINRDETSMQDQAKSIQTFCDEADGLTKKYLANFSQVKTDVALSKDIDEYSSIQELLQEIIDWDEDDVQTLINKLDDTQFESIRNALEDLVADESSNLHPFAKHILEDFISKKLVPKQESFAKKLSKDIDAYKSVGEFLDEFKSKGWTDKDILDFANGLDDDNYGDFYQSLENIFEDTNDKDGLKDYAKHILTKVLNFSERAKIKNFAAQVDSFVDDVENFTLSLDVPDNPNDGPNDDQPATITDIVETETAQDVTPDPNIIDNPIVDKLNEDIVNQKETQSTLGNIDNLEDGVANLSKKNFADVDRTKVKEYAMSIATEIYGDNTDESIVDGIVDNAINKAEGDEGKAMGIVKNSYRKNFSYMDSVKQFAHAGDGKIDEVRNKIVPLRGPSKYVEGELLRVMDKLYYEFFEHDILLSDNNPVLDGIIEFADNDKIKQLINNTVLDKIKKLKSEFNKAKYQKMLESAYEDAVRFILSLNNYTENKDNIDYTKLV